MSEESTIPDLVEVTRRVFEAIERKEWDAVMSFVAPAAVWDASDTGIATFVGDAAIRGLLEDWSSTFEEFRIEVEEVVDLGNGVSLAVTYQRGRPLGSTGEVRRREALVCVWEEGMVTHMTTYPDSETAGAAAERLARERG